MAKEVLESKKAVVSEIKDRYNEAKSVIFVNYKGINVEQDTKLRKAFREAGVKYKIYKKDTKQIYNITKIVTINLTKLANKLTFKI